jgi:hypothetical protein
VRQNSPRALLFGIRFLAKSSATPALTSLFSLRSRSLVDADPTPTVPGSVESVVVPSEFAVVAVAVDIPVVAVVIAVVVPVVVACVVDEHGEEVHDDDGEGDEQTPKVGGDGDGEVELLSHLHFPLELMPRSGSKTLDVSSAKQVDVKQSLRSKSMFVFGLNDISA